MSDSSTTRFLLLYALAWAGGTVAYVPLLTIVLPAHVAALAGPDQAVTWLGYLAMIGAIAASVGGVLFGWLSDVTRTRGIWIVAGLMLSCLLLVQVTQARGLDALIAIIVSWQLALNMMLGPLAALAADRVPDARKGVLGGLIAFAPGMGALAGVLVTLPGVAPGAEQLRWIVVMVTACVAPLLFVEGWRRSPIPALEADPATKSDSHRDNQSAFVRMWYARLAVQIAEAALFAYLLYWLTSVDPSVAPSAVARLFTVAMAASAPLALIIGGMSDRAVHPMVVLGVLALVVAVGLIGMVGAQTLSSAMLSYIVFGIAGAVFLSLHAAQTMRILPDPTRRGRDLGLFNLANTAPSLVMPWIAIAIVPRFGYPGFFIVLAALACVAGLWLISMAYRARPSA